MTPGAVRAPHLEGDAVDTQRVVVDLDNAGSTPILREYRVVKAEHPDHIVLGRMGDFYELIGNDAELAAPVLGVTLTSRNFGKAGRLPMCGVPHHAAPAYIRRLLDAGFSVALWDQVGEVISGKLVKREVTRVLTPGTRVDSEYIDDGTTARCCALHVTDETLGAAIFDASTGELEYIELVNDLAVGGQNLTDVCTKLGVAELLLAHGVELDAEILSQVHRSRIPASYFDAKRAAERLSVIDVASELRTRGGPALAATGAVLAYAQDLKLQISSDFIRLRPAHTAERMTLDAATIRNLELLKPSNPDGTAVINILDHTGTPMGARALRRLLVEPFNEPTSIQRRHAALADFLDDKSRGETRRALRQVRDLERLVGRCVQAIATPRDLGAIRDALKSIPELHSALTNATSELVRTAAVELDVPTNLLETLAERLVDDPPAHARDGGAIRPGADSELDLLHSSSSDARTYIAALEAAERESTGIRNLKVGYNRVFGYYLEIPISQKDAAPVHYIRKQTLANAERFVTAELKDHETTVLSARDRAVAREQELLRECVTAVVERAADLAVIAGAVTVVDVAQSMAETARLEQWTEPTVDSSDTLEIEAGRHPIVEHSLGPGRFVANDCMLGDGQRIQILTGPNMAGKSTYLRQVALIALLAQIGSYVPATRARIGVCDRIFTRVGASDDLARGMSTFMLEMSETAHIVKNATRRSLVILDEIGRGTSTYDGLSIAQALVEHLHDSPQLDCRTLFATHYHELTALADELPRVANARVDVLEEGHEITFLHRIVSGGADRSYGIHVAKLAGIPSGVLLRARELLAEREQSQPLAVTSQPNQLDFGMAEAPASPIVEELLDLKLEELTPIAALNKLAELQERLS